MSRMLLEDAAEHAMEPDRKTTVWDVCRFVLWCIIGFVALTGLGIIYGQNQAAQTCRQWLGLE